MIGKNIAQKTTGGVDVSTEIQRKAVNIIMKKTFTYINAS